MNFMKDERQIFEDLYPGFAEEVVEIPLEEREGPDSDVVERFRKVNGPTLLVPKEYGGTGASAVALTMQFSGRIPVVSSSTISGIPPILVELTGRPEAPVSINALDTPPSAKTGTGRRRQRSSVRSARGVSRHPARGVSRHPALAGR